MIPERGRRLELVPVTGEASAAPMGETYAALINRKALVPSATTPYFAIEQHLLFRLMALALESVDIDEDWYVSRNSDVAEAIRDGSVRNASYHYRRFGFYEHRLPYAIEIDEEWYLEAYADVKEGLLRKDFASAQSHFETVGFREGRLPYPDFTLAVRKFPPAVARLPRVSMPAAHE
jgi:hypothetical protein